MLPGIVSYTLLLELFEEREDGFLALLPPADANDSLMSDQARWREHPVAVERDVGRVCPTRPA